MPRNPPHLPTAVVETKVIIAEPQYDDDGEQQTEVSSVTGYFLEDDHDEGGSGAEVDAAPGDGSGDNHRRRYYTTTTTTTTVDEPDLDTTKVIGRDVERKILLETWNRIVHQDSCLTDGEDDSDEKDMTKEEEEDADTTTTVVRGAVVHVHGESGSGKTRLVDSIRSVVVDNTINTKKNNNNNTNDTSGLFISGKFDQLSAKRFPFQGIIDALSDLCDVVAMRPDVRKVGAAIESSMSREDWALFQRLLSVPTTLNQCVYNAEEEFKVEEVLSEDLVEVSAKDGTSDARLKRTCHLLIQSVASICPLLIFLDDLQWANRDCVSLIKSLVSTVSTHARVVFILAFRDGQRTSERLSSTRNLVAPMNDNSNNNGNNNSTGVGIPTVIDIPLSNFDQQRVNSLLSHVLFMSPSELESSELGRIIFEKTEGNPFFIVQFLELTRVSGLLQWNMEAKQWEFSDIASVVRLDVSEGVLSSIDARIYQLTSKARSILMMAAHLGFEFRRDMLRAVVLLSPIYQRFSKADESASFIDEALEEAQRVRLIVSGKGNNKNTFYFMHDRVQEGFYEMIQSGSQKERFFLNIGRSLMREEKTRKDWKDDIHVLFTMTDSMNNGRSQISNEHERFALVELNAAAADRASQSCLFSLASSYLTIAIELLPMPQSWNNKYDLTLQLHEKVALMHCNLRRLEDAHHVLDEIMLKARSVSDKQTAGLVRFLAYELQGKNQDATDTALKALAELGVTVKENPHFASIFGKLFQVKWLMRNKTDEDLLKLPKMTDKTRLAVTAWYQKLVHQAFVTGNENLMVYCLLDTFRLSLLYGQTQRTPSATAAFGMMDYAMSRNVIKANRMGRLAIKMLEDFDADCDACSTQLLAQLALLTWQEPIDTCIEPLNKAFESGLRHGDAHHAVGSLGAAAGVHVYLGQGLLQTEAEMRRCTMRIAELAGMNSVVLLTRFQWQTVLNIMGRNDEHLILTGEAVCEEDMLKNPNEEEEGIAKTGFILLKFLLACHFRSLYTAKELLMDLREREKNRSTFLSLAPNAITYQFFACLTYLDLIKAAKTSGSPRKYLNQAKRTYRDLSRVALGSHSYATALIGILDAEMHIVKTGSVDRVLFDKAIQQASDAGFPNYAAIACERAGQALSKEKGLSIDEEVYQYMLSGLRLNKEWEAFGKVEWFKNTYFTRFQSEEYPMPSTVIVSSQRS